MTDKTYHQKKLYELIATKVQARRNCIALGNTEWLDRHTDALTQIGKDLLPSGSGFDAGTTIDLDKSNRERLVFTTSFHHMNDGGYYDGWTEHVITVTPAFLGGFHLRLTGQDRNGIKEYIAETFYHQLFSTVCERYDPDTDTFAYAAVRPAELGV